jgi:hypothetical protein
MSVGGSKFSRESGKKQWWVVVGRPKSKEEGVWRTLYNDFTQ